MNEMHEILLEFSAETRENLLEVEQALVQLEDDPSDVEQITIIFRAIHTVKGTCGFFGFDALERVTHVGENLLSALRDGALSLTKEMTSTLLELVDVIRRFMDRIEETDSEAGVDINNLPERLEILRQGKPLSVLRQAETVELEDDEVIEAKPEVVEAKSEVIEAKSEVVEVEAEIAEPPRPAPQRPPSAPSAPRVEPEPAPEHGEKKAARVKADAESVRVTTHLLDQLVTLVGELVLTRNQIVQRVEAHPDQVLTPASQRLNLIASELQEAVMKTRMQPLSTVFNRFPRLVRDVAQACDKQVQLEVKGGETELDRTLIEAIKDPLTHILRNAIDHGVEDTKRRAAAGKPEVGRVLVTAYHKGGFVNIDIADDGGGIDARRLKEKALSAGLITGDQLARFSEREAFALIFLPGLSTAGAVTNVSGRGVGMDVVRSKVEAIGGTVELTSTLGEGTTIKLKIPLTLAIVPALMIRCDGERYAIPQSNLQELLRFDPSDKDKQRLENIGGAWYHRLRGQLLPLVYLRHVLHPDQPRVDQSQVHQVVVLQAGEQNYGLVVDGVQDSQEIVVKPLDSLLQKLSIYGGTMITGDGRAALILDPVGIANQAALSAKQVRVTRQVDEASVTKGQILLLVGSMTKGRMAFPLSMVSRLEEFERDKVEVVGGRRSVEYRGEIMQLVNLSELLPERRTHHRHGVIDVDSLERLSVVVHSNGARNIGLIVGQIIDTVEEDTRTRGRPSRDGVAYTFVQDGHITEFLSLQSLVEKAEPDFYEAQ